MSIMQILNAAAPFLGAGASLLTAGGTIAGGILQNKAIEKANKENLAYARERDAAEERRSSVLAGQQQQQLDLNKKTSMWGKQQQDYENTRLKEESNYKRMQTAADKYAEYLNANAAITSNKMAGFQRR